MKPIYRTTSFNMKSGSQAVVDSRIRRCTGNDVIGLTDQLLKQHAAAFTADGTQKQQRRPEFILHNRADTINTSLSTLSSYDSLAFGDDTARTAAAVAVGCDAINYDFDDFLAGGDYYSSYDDSESDDITDTSSLSSDESSYDDGSSVCSFECDASADYSRSITLVTDDIDADDDEEFSISTRSSDIDYNNCSISTFCSIDSVAAAVASANNPYNNSNVEFYDGEDEQEKEEEEAEDQAEEGIKSCKEEEDDEAVDEPYYLHDALASPSSKRLLIKVPTPSFFLQLQEEDEQNVDVEDVTPVVENGDAKPEENQGKKKHEQEIRRSKGILATKSKKNVSKSKQVTFRPTAVVQPTVHLNDMSEKLIQSLYMDGEEAHKVRIDAMELVHRMEANGQVPQLQDTKAGCCSGDCFRGLEKHTAKNNEQLRSKRQQLNAAVLKIQSLDLPKGMMDIEATIADICFQLTKDSVEKAREYGLEDEKEAKVVQAEDTQ